MTEPTVAIPAPPAATHVHIDNVAQDCDGKYERSNVEAGDLGDYFRWFHLPVTRTGGFTLDCDSDGLWWIEFSTPTDEGFTSTTIRECVFDCDFEKLLFCDYTVERAGY